MASPTSVKMNVNLEELYQLIGERETIKFKQAQQIEQLFEQIGEMSQEIERLRAENAKLKEERDGKLGESPHHDSIRRVLVGVQGQGRGCGDDVSERTDFPSDGISEDGPSGGGEGQIPGIRRSHVR